MNPPKDVLLTGATGFVGQHLYPALISAGYTVRCATRDLAAARAASPGRDWVLMDVEDRDSVLAAMEGCRSAYFLVHGMDHHRDYPEREKRGANAFAQAAEALGLRRVVYLGGVVPGNGRVSRHLRSRRETGEILRASRTSSIELRAAMIIGNGSASWTMVRDLAARLPAMLLPSWLRNCSYPVFIDDVVTGLLGALASQSNDSHCYELSGPERVTHREMLDRTATAMGRRPVMWNVPVLSPRLSSYWIALVTRVDLGLARELVEGVRHDLIPSGDSLWDKLGCKPTPLDDSIRLALADDPRGDWPSPETTRRLVNIGTTNQRKSA